MGVATFCELNYKQTFSTFYRSGNVRTNSSVSSNRSPLGYRGTLVWFLVPITLLCQAYTTWPKTRFQDITKFFGSNFSLSRMPRANCFGHLYQQPYFVRPTRFSTWLKIESKRSCSLLFSKTAIASSTASSCRARAGAIPPNASRTRTRRCSSKRCLSSS